MLFVSYRRNPNLKIHTGHLTLLLMRYLYETKVLPLPAAMMLFSVRLLSRLVSVISSDLSAALG